MKQNYAIIGLGRFGGSICRTLIESGQEVLAIDSNEDRVNEYMNIAKAQNEYHARVLEKLGADRVVHPERDMGIRIAHNLVSKNILDYIELSDEFSLAEIRVSNPRFFNRSLLDLNFRQKYGLTVVAIRRGPGQVIVSPAADSIVRENDNLLVIGNTDDVDILDEHMND